MARQEARGKPKRKGGANRKKYSINVEDGQLVSVEVDGVEYRDPEDIPDAEDRDMVEMLLVGGPDTADDDFAEPFKESTALPNIILLVFGGVAVLMLAITVIAAAVATRSLAREVSVQGRVVEFIPITSSDGGVLYQPVVDFMGVDNERHIVPSGGGSRPPAYRLGQQVEIRYNPADPNTARIATTGSNIEQYLVALITGVLAVAFVAATVFAWWINKPETSATAA